MQEIIGLLKSINSELGIVTFLLTIIMLFKNFMVKDEIEKFHKSFDIRMRDIKDELEKFNNNARR